MAHVATPHNGEGSVHAYHPNVSSQVFVPGVRSLWNCMFILIRIHYLVTNMYLENWNYTILWWIIWSTKIYGGLVDECWLNHQAKQSNKICDPKIIFPYWFYRKTQSTFIVFPATVHIIFLCTTGTFIVMTANTIYKQTLGH